MTVKLIRMWSGEDVITDVVEKTKDHYIIENPIVAVPSQQQGQIAFAPWSPLLAKGDGIEVTKNMLFTKQILKKILSNSTILCLVNCQHLQRN